MADPIEVPVEAVDETTEILRQIEENTRRAGRTAEESAKKQEDAFTKAKDAVVLLNQGVELAGKVWRGFDDLLLTGPLRTFDTLLTVGGDLVDSYDVQARAVVQLGAAMQRQGQFTLENLEVNRAWAAQLQESVNVGDEVSLRLLALAGSVVGFTDETRQAVESAIDISVGSGTGFDENIRAITRATQTGSFELKGYGTIALQAGDAQGRLTEAIRLSEAAYGGFAAAAAQAGAGLAESLRLAFGDLEETVGRAIINSPDVRAGLRTLRQLVNDIADTIEDDLAGAGSIIGSVFTASFNAAFDGAERLIGIFEAIGFAIGEVFETIEALTLGLIDSPTERAIERFTRIRDELVQDAGGIGFDLNASTIPQVDPQVIEFLRDVRTLTGEVGDESTVTADKVSQLRQRFQEFADQRRQQAAVAEEFLPGTGIDPFLEDLDLAVRRLSQLERVVRAVGGETGFGDTLLGALQEAAESDLVAQLREDLAEARVAFEEFRQEERLAREEGDDLTRTLLNLATSGDQSEQAITAATRALAGFTRGSKEGQTASELLAQAFQFGDLETRGIETFVGDVEQFRSRIVPLVREVTEGFFELTGPGSPLQDDSARQAAEKLFGSIQEQVRAFGTEALPESIQRVEALGQVFTVTGDDSDEARASIEKIVEALNAIDTTNAELMEQRLDEIAQTVQNDIPPATQELGESLADSAIAAEDLSGQIDNVVTGTEAAADAAARLERSLSNARVPEVPDAPDGGGTRPGIGGSGGTQGSASEALTRAADELVGSADAITSSADTLELSAAQIESAIQFSADVLSESGQQLQETSSDLDGSAVNLDVSAGNHSAAARQLEVSADRMTSSALEWGRTSSQLNQLLTRGIKIDIPPPPDIDLGQAEFALLQAGNKLQQSASRLCQAASNLNQAAGRGGLGSCQAGGITLGEGLVQVHSNELIAPLNGPGVQLIADAFRQAFGPGGAPGGAGGGGVTLNASFGSVTLDPNQFQALLTELSRMLGDAVQTGFLLPGGV